MRGFSLLEALIALTLVGAILLLGFALQIRQVRQRQGLETEERLLADGQALVVSLQGGLHPLRSGPVDPLLAWPHQDGSGRAFQVELAEGGADGLCLVSILGRATSATGRWHDLRLTTKIWRRGHPCV